MGRRKKKEGWKRGQNEEKGWGISRRICLSEGTNTWQGKTVLKKMWWVHKEPSRLRGCLPVCFSNSCLLYRFSFSHSFKVLWEAMHLFQGSCHCSNILEPGPFLGLAWVLAAMQGQRDREREWEREA
jgi:hypothetical protein